MPVTVKIPLTEHSRELKGDHAAKKDAMKNEP
jgi:hypothetical protein